MQSLADFAQYIPLTVRPLGHASPPLVFALIEHKAESISGVHAITKHERPAPSSAAAARANNNDVNLGPFTILITSISDRSPKRQALATVRCDIVAMMLPVLRREIPAVFFLAIACAACGSDDSDQDVNVYQADNTQQCATQSVEGLDVYSGDGTINWTDVAASGRAFVFIKATQGNYDIQSNFATNWAGAKAAGMLRSPYHFFDATIDGIED